MPPGSPWNRRSVSPEDSLGLDGLNQVITALDRSERLNAQLPIAITPGSLVSPRTITIEDQASAAPVATTMNVRLTGFEAGTGRYSWTEVYLDLGTGAFLDKVGGKSGDFETDWAIEINGLADCWDPTPGVKSFARIVPSEGFGFYRFYQIKKGEPEEPCVQRTITVRIITENTRSPVSVFYHSRSPAQTSYIEILNPQGNEPGVFFYEWESGYKSEFVVDVDNPINGIGEYQITVQLRVVIDADRGIFKTCQYTSTVDFKESDCKVVVDVPVCCTSVRARVYSCQSSNYDSSQALLELSPITVTVEESGESAVADLNSDNGGYEATFDQDFPHPVPLTFTVSSSVSGPGYDSGAVSATGDLSCLGGSFADLPTFHADESHICSCGIAMAPKELHYSDMHGNSCTLTYGTWPVEWEQGGFIGWSGGYGVTSPNVHHNTPRPIPPDWPPGKPVDCLESEGGTDSATVRVFFKCVSGSNGTVSYSLMKQVNICRFESSYNVYDHYMIRDGDLGSGLAVASYVPVDIETHLQFPGQFEFVDAPGSGNPNNTEGGINYIDKFFGPCIVTI